MGYGGIIPPIFLPYFCHKTGYFGRNLGKCGEMKKWLKPLSIKGFIDISRILKNWLEGILSPLRLPFRHPG